MLQLYSSEAFFSYPTIMYFTAGVTGVFLHRMWRRGASKEKKKCGFMICCRERPTWLGSSREKDKLSHTVFKLMTGRHTCPLHNWHTWPNHALFALPSSEYDPPFSRTEISYFFEAQLRCEASRRAAPAAKLHLLLETGRGKLRAMNRSLRNGGAALEAFKFACYLAVPIGMTVFVAYNPTMLNKVIQNRKYVVYPPEGPRPPSNEELWEKLGKRSQDNGSAAK